MRCFDIHLKDEFPLLGEAGRDPLLSAYLPFNMTEMKRQDWKRPCILVCPGGGYHFCSQREAEVVGMPFLAEGFNVFVLNYSVNSDRFPVQLREVAACMELIYANADAWNCDTGRVVIMGFSAGGHLACHYSNAYDCPEVREVFPDSKCVNAAILCYPVITADPAFSHRGSIRNLTGHEEPTAEDLERFSCEKLVSEKTPPTFLWHTADDTCVPVKNSLVYAQALAEHKVTFSLHIYPWGEHGFATADLQTNKPHELTPQTLLASEWLKAAKDWLKTVF